MCDTSNLSIYFVCYSCTLCALTQVTNGCAYAGFQLIGPAIAVQFHGKNSTAMAFANELVQNMTINFRCNCRFRIQ